MSLPISPSGLGTGDLAFITSMERFGVEPNPALAFVILIRLALYSVSLAGFFLWIMPGTHITRKKLAVEAEELQECGQTPEQKT